MFFVLSGFLITAILFKGREESDKLNISKLSLIKNFYVRRALRISPIYYLTILILYFFESFIGIDIKTDFVFLITYTTNFYIFFTKSWHSIGHLWSLAVEEQFYFIWPFIIVFINKKYYLHVIVSFIFIGIISKYIFNNPGFGHIITPTCFDAFGIGALLAWQVFYKLEKFKQFFIKLSFVTIISFLLFIVCLISRTWVVPCRTLVSIITMWVIAYIVINAPEKRLRLKFILDNKFLIFIGKISYGIYLYHNLLPEALDSKFIDKYLNIYLPTTIKTNYISSVLFIENLILIILLSWVSYIFIEKKFLNLKKYFEYDERKTSIG
jgi:peptidoglycan/LPS O-acetylase OafA/YrhL